MHPLQERLAQVRAEINISAMTYDFETILDRYRNGRIAPPLTTGTIWNEVEESRFIEAALLNLPLTPIFGVSLPKEESIVITRGWEQLSAYRHFIGDGGMQPLQLTGCSVFEELNGKTYADLNSTLQRRLRHKPLDVYVAYTDEFLRWRTFGTYCTNRYQSNEDY